MLEYMKLTDYFWGLDNMYAITAKGMKYIDEYTINQGVNSAVLMENAAKGVVNTVKEIFPDVSTRILVLAGTGNNGGDALCTARWLIHYGYDVKIYCLGDFGNSSLGCISQLRILRNMYPDADIAGDGINSNYDYLKLEYDVIIDGIFGIGLNRRLGDNYVKFINFINEKNGLKIAIDIPSGLNATTGQKMNGAFKADITVTFSSYKTGMFFEDGKEYCGNIRVIDIGIDKKAYNNISEKLFVCDEKFFDGSKDMALEPRKEKSHKGTYGTVGIIIGDAGMMGAGILASKAAYRTGCGLVKIFCPAKYLGFLNVSVPEAIAVPYTDENYISELAEFLELVDVVLIGPGLSEDYSSIKILKYILHKNVNAVIDAGALNIIARDMRPFINRKCKCVITPHIGEMARLCGEKTDVILKNRIGFTKKFSEKYEVSMVLKSDVSIISLLINDEQLLFLNSMGNSGLATAGSGDVLSGIIASLIAQDNSMNNSLLYGTMIHAASAIKYGNDENSKRRMVAGDIIENLF